MTASVNLFRLGTRAMAVAEMAAIFAMVVLEEEEVQIK
jgi:hypothetical protein